MAQWLHFRASVRRRMAISPRRGTPYFHICVQLHLCFFPKIFFFLSFKPSHISVKKTFLRKDIKPAWQLNIKHLMTGPEGNSEFCFPRISMFPETKSRETLRFEGNKIHCYPREQTLSDLLYSKTKQKQNLKTALRFQPSRATAINSELLTG